MPERGIVMDYSSLLACAGESGCTVTLDAPLAEYTSFRIGGAADVLVDIPDGEAAGKILALCRREAIPTLWLGNGSNILVGDGGFRGAVLRWSADGEPTLLNEVTVYAPAGIPLKKLCMFARDNGLTGLEFAFGIPGTVGGGVFMNAGAYGGELGQVIRSVDCLTPEGETVTYGVGDLGFGYRHTRLMDEGSIVAGATFVLTQGSAEVVEARMKELLARRREKQPLEYPSAGSFFKRPEGHFAGALIESAGLKGCRRGDAQVSEKHAGFIVNLGHATAKDVTELCTYVQETVWERNGVRLEPEVRFVGEFTE